MYITQGETYLYKSNLALQTSNKLIQDISIARHNDNNKITTTTNNNNNDNDDNNSSISNDHTVVLFLTNRWHYW